MTYATNTAANTHDWQVFKFVGIGNGKGHLINARNNKVIDAKDDKDFEGNELGLSDRTNKGGQQWQIVYKNETTMDDEGVDSDFGFHRGRPFYIVSKLPMKRVL